MLRVYRYRLYPTRAQDAALRETLVRLRELYNAALQHRRDAYRRQGVSVSAYSQMRELVGVRLVRPEYAAIHTHLLQDAMAQMRLAKQVHDAAWAQFRTILTAKAESAGRYLVAVDPRGTSQYCSGCGVEVRKTLAVRIHDCPSCGIQLDRDVNAAKNVQRRGQRRRGGVSSERLEEPRSPYLAVCGR